MKVHVGYILKNTVPFAGQEPGLVLILRMACPIRSELLPTEIHFYCYLDTIQPQIVM